MQEAVDAGYYNVSSYESIGEESRDRIKLQEFAYWFITSAWGLQTTYGDSDTNEWSLKNSSSLQSNMSTCYTQLITNGANKVITVPGDSFSMRLVTLTTELKNQILNTKVLGSDKSPCG